MGGAPGSLCGKKTGGGELLPGEGRGARDKGWEVTSESVRGIQSYIIHEEKVFVSFYAMLEFGFGLWLGLFK